MFGCSRLVFPAFSPCLDTLDFDNLDASKRADSGWIIKSDFTGFIKSWNPPPSSLCLILIKIYLKSRFQILLKI
jgi:hypothetical protein